MELKRSSGILLHPTSLPGPDGIGDLGPEAYNWINFLSDTGCSLWEILPLGPTGYGDSPYQCFSAFAGNPYLVNPAFLMDTGLLKRSDVLDRPQFPLDHVDFGPVIQWKLLLLDRAYARFVTTENKSLTAVYEDFCNKESYWLDDFALFMAIKETNNGVSWDQWEKPLRMHEEKALSEFTAEHHLEVEKHKFRQFLFFRQWMDVKEYAASKGIKVIGDAPIFVAFDSADAWANPELFFLDKDRKPTVVAGVPPDYFSPTGQLWGNPLYNWKAHEKTGFDWWIKRLKSLFKLVDIVRLDHFRGFAGYWEIPFGNPTAEIGRWVPGPGKPFFEALQKALGDLPIIAEDLGEITPDVVELRDAFNFPGMKILQFGFSSDSSDPFLPHNYPRNCVAFTGTHDNDTVWGWYRNTATEKEKDFCRRYLARSGEDIAHDLIRAVWFSVAAFALCPMQDLLNLGGEARMNFPGKPGGNWQWRMLAGAVPPWMKNQLREWNSLYSRG